jgi:hypothetical protein
VSITGNDATTIDVSDDSEAKTAEECCDEAAQVMEKIFKFGAAEFEGVEEEEAEEEEEEGAGGEEAFGEEDVDGEEAEEEEEDEDNFDPAVRDRKTMFGETSYFCPVSLFKRGVLVPGNLEIQARYRERIYRSEINILFFISYS